MKKPKPTDQDVLSALEGVVDPLSGLSIVASNMVSGLSVDARGHVRFVLEVTSEHGPAMESLRQEAEAVARKVAGVRQVTAVLTAERSAQAPPPHLQQRKRPSAPPPHLLKDVKHVIAVASGKGGVGKSTVAANLALALQAQGLKVGLLDADIYGPSVPTLMGVRGQRCKPFETEDGVKKIRALNAHGLTLMSMGFLTSEEAPVIWRGPMIQSALLQMMRDVDWGELDVLVIDMPPGTGDAQLTLAQKVPLSGAVIVSTPQDLALIDARKGLEMFRKTHVPILGVIENMSTFICPHCGEASEVFSHGGAQAEAEHLGVPFLGAIPLDMEIRQSSESGVPIVAARPDSVQAKGFINIARQVSQAIVSVPA